MLGSLGYLVLVVGMVASLGIQETTYQQLLKSDASFNGTVTLVTGGSTGIGYATALLIAQRGGTVVICARDKHPSWYNTKLAAVKINLDATVIFAGGSASFFQADVTKPQEIRDFIDFAHNKYGRIDNAVFNAGIFTPRKAIDTFDDDVFLSATDDLYNNLYGTIICLKEFTKYWMTRADPNGTYSIVMLSSILGHKASTGNLLLYSTSKHAINGLIQLAALEYAGTSPRIRVNGVAPGYTDTFMVRNYAVPRRENECIKEDNPVWVKQIKPAIEQSLPNKRMAKPSEMAAAIAYLSSKEADYVSGHIITVDGGISTI